MPSEKEAEKLINYLRKMLEIRYFEEKVMDLLSRDVVKGASHLYVGAPIEAMDTA